MTLVAGYVMHMQQLNVAFLLLFLRPNKWITVPLLLYLVKTAKQLASHGCMQGSCMHATRSKQLHSWQVLPWRVANQHALIPINSC
jgi:hypothetical protein